MEGTRGRKRTGGHGIGRIELNVGPAYVLADFHRQWNVCSCWASHGWMKCDDRPACTAMLWAGHLELDFAGGWRSDVLPMPGELTGVTDGGGAAGLLRRGGLEAGGFLGGRATRAGRPHVKALPAGGAVGGPGADGRHQRSGMSCGRVPLVGSREPVVWWVWPGRPGFRRPAVGRLVSTNVRTCNDVYLQAGPRRRNT